MSSESKSINSLLKYTFLLHAVVAVVFGLPLLIIPGASLDLLGWTPQDPLVSRMLGAAILGFGWSSIRGFISRDWSQVRIIVEAEAIFCTLAAVGLLRHLLISTYPWYVWMIFILFFLFAVLWVIAYLTNRE